MAFLLIAVFVITLIFALLPELLPQLSKQIVGFVVPEKEDEEKLREDLRLLRLQLKEINMVDEFAKYAKTERKIIRASEQLKTINKSKTDVLMKIKLGANVVFQFIQVLVFLGFIYTYRSVPLMHLAEGWFYPISKWIAFPTGIPGAVGITCWMLVCRNVIRKALDLVKTS